jgi:hypothetical protein
MLADLVSNGMEDPVEHFVPLNRVPDGLQFPADLSHRIQYDADRRRLVFRGFMSKAEFDRLCLLTEDWGYRRSLEELFRLSTAEPESPSGVFRRVLTALAGRA